MEASAIRERRKLLGLTLGELADKARVSKRTIMRAEGGETVQQATLRSIHEALGLDFAPEPTPPGAVSETVEVISAGDGAHPLMGEFMEALRGCPDLLFVVLPDVDAIRGARKPAFKALLDRFDVLALLGPDGQGRSPFYNPLIALAAGMLVIAFGLGVFLSHTIGGMAGVACFVILSCLVHATPVLLASASYPGDLRIHERTAYGIQGNGFQIVTVHEEAVQVLSHDVLAWRGERLPCGSAWDWYVGGARLRALPDDRRLLDHMTSDKAFHGVNWIPRKPPVMNPSP